MSLDTPLTFPCGLVLPNRMAMAPLTNCQSHPDGTLADDEYAWLMRRATGGWGLLSTCATYVSDEGKAWNGQLGAATDGHLPGLTRLATDLREAGAVAIVQLHHAGAKADEAAVKLSTADGDGIRGATEADIARVTADFVAAARRCEAAGFAGVEIHGANGYLFTQFLAPKDNPRTDGYGGDLAGRARFLREVTRAVRAAVSSEFAVGVRLSPVDHYAPRGLLLADSVQVGAWLAEDGADFVHLSLRDAAGPAPLEDGDVAVARAIRDGLPGGVAVLAAGGVWTRADAQRAVEAGVDVVVLGKAAIGNPDWPRESGADGYEPARHPFEPDHLRAVAVSDTFMGYIGQFPGMVVGGADARG